MSISLQKGQKISLTKESAGLSKMVIGLGWDEVKQKRGFFSAKPAPIDCDASAIVLRNGKLIDPKDLIYYGNLKHPSGAIQHMGDNLTGAGDGDDEQVVVDLSKVPADVDRIVLVVNIYMAAQRNQHFGLIENAFIRTVDANTGREICKYSLTDNYSGMTAMIFGEVYRHGDEWKFNAIGQGTNDPSLNEVIARYR